MEELFSAVRKRQADEVTRLLEKNPVYECHNIIKYTIKRKYCDMLILLAGHGASMTGPDILDVAAATGKLSMVKLVVELGASTDLPSISNAIQSTKTVEIAAYLLGLSTEFTPCEIIRKITKHYPNSIMQCDSIPLLELYLDNGFDPSTNFHWVICRALGKRNIEKIHLLVAHTRFNTTYRYAFDPDAMAIYIIYFEANIENYIQIKGMSMRCYKRDDYSEAFVRKYIARMRPHKSARTG